MLDRLHGQNLRFAEEEIGPLSEVVYPSLEDAATGADVIVVGKIFPSEKVDQRLLPEAATILDLTRQLTTQREGDKLHRLGGTQMVPAPGIPPQGDPDAF